MFDPVRAVGRAWSSPSSSRRLKTDGVKSQDSVCGDSFDFILCFSCQIGCVVPAAVAFSARLDAIRLLSFLWLCGPLNPSPPLSSTLTLFFFFFFYNSFLLSSFVASSCIPRFSNRPSSHLSSQFSSPLLFPSPATLRLNSSLPPHPLPPPLCSSPTPSSHSSSWYDRITYEANHPWERL